MMHDWLLLRMQIIGNLSLFFLHNLFVTQGTVYFGTYYTMSLHDWAFIGGFNFSPLNVFIFLKEEIKLLYLLIKKPQTNCSFHLLISALPC